jgi:hypothetical protein
MDKRSPPGQQDLHRKSRAPRLQGLHCICMAQTWMFMCVRAALTLTVDCLAMGCSLLYVCVLLSSGSVFTGVFRVVFNFFSS